VLGDFGQGTATQRQDRGDDVAFRCKTGADRAKSCFQLRAQRMEGFRVGYRDHGHSPGPSPGHQTVRQAELRSDKVDKPGIGQDCNDIKALQSPAFGPHVKDVAFVDKATGAQHLGQGGRLTPVIGKRIQDVVGTDLAAQEKGRGDLRPAAGRAGGLSSVPVLCLPSHAAPDCLRGKHAGPELTWR
jgi:hypothetical protein